ncbi:MAG: response regulator [Limnobacter sp.]|nr:response regulator [Limnobacter sp.]
MAIEEALSKKFDIILMDLQMPEVDGFEATATIQAHFKDKCPPIVAVTASATEKDRVAILKAGMCEHW